MPVRDKKFGLVLPQWTESMGGDTARGADIIGQAKLCEELGFDSLWTADQILFDLGEYTSVVGATPSDDPSGSKRGYWECWAIIGTLASATSRIEIGTLVSCTAYRNPALLARMADTVDELSNGRLILGLYDWIISRSPCLWGTPEEVADRLAELRERGIYNWMLYPDNPEVDELTATRHLGKASELANRRKGEPSTE